MILFSHHPPIRRTTRRKLVDTSRQNAPSASSPVSSDRQVHKDKPFRISVNRVPTEVWMCILSAQDLTPYNIQSFSLTCRFFRSLAQPLLFNKISSTRIPYRSIDWQSDGYYRSLLSKLHFVCRDPYQKHVRVLALRKGSIASPPSFGSVTGNEVIKVVFNALPHLKNLRTISLDDVTFSEVHLYALQTLHNLTDLHLRRCGIERLTVQVPKLRIKMLSINSCGEFAWWKPLAGPPICQSLSLITLEDCEAAFKAYPIGSKLPALRTLRMHSMSTSRPPFESFLGCCTEVRHLILSHASKREFIALSAAAKVPRSWVLPNLAHLTVPFTLIPVLTSTKSRPIRSLTTRLEFHVPTNALIQISDAIPDVESVTLHLPRLSYLNEGGFQLYGTLRTLYIRSDIIPIGDILAFCGRLHRLHLPPCLTDIHIGCETLSPGLFARANNITSQALPDIELLLNERCPDLQHLLLLAPSEYIEWQDVPSCPKPCFLRPLPEWYEEVHLD